MKTSNYLNIVLGLGLVALGWRYASICNQNGVSSTAENDFQLAQTDGNPAINIIMTRHSVRSYTDEAISDEDMNTILRAGMAAPTAMDSRPWHFVVATERDALRQVAEKMPNAKMAAEAPAVIVVCGDTTKMLDGRGRDYWIQDCSAATENILLAAHALGLGAVWCGIAPIEERMTDTRSIFHLADNLVPFNIIVMGHPSGEGKIKDKWNENDITFFEP